MENFDQPLDVGMGASAEQDGLRITQEVRTYWNQISKWALFFAILFFIMFGLVSLIGFFGAVVAGLAGFVAGLFGVAIYGAVLFFPGLYYYRFYTQMKQALLNDDNAMLEESFSNLKRYYQYMGILVILFLALYVIMFLVFGAAMMRMGLPSD